MLAGSITCHFSLNRTIYSCLFYLAIPFVMLRLLYRSLKEPLYRYAIRERFGAVTLDVDSTQVENLVWVHAVSAGETIAAVPLVERLLEDGYYCLVTNMTPTGREQVRSRLGERVLNSYAPYDLPGAMTRFLDRVRPKALILIDTELWPNMVNACHVRSIPVLVVNARLSERSARGYRRVASLSKSMMNMVDTFAVQTDSHRRRFESLGVDPARISVAGSVKFDQGANRLADADIDVANEVVGHRNMVMGASTHEGEEAALLDLLPALQAADPDILLVLAPRHTHRLNAVIACCEARHIKPVTLTQYQHRRELNSPVFIIDVMGQLDAWYPMAKVAFIGGSLVPVGGHNLLEAVRADAAVVMGPHLDNIDDIAGQFVDAGGLNVVEDSLALEKTVNELLSDTSRRRAMIHKARAVYEVNRGALDRVFKLVTERLKNG